MGYFRDEYVNQKKWLDEKTYADLVALCQFLPGPASSQVGIAIGMLRAGIPGAIASWIGFTFPSVIALTLFAYFLQDWNVKDLDWLRGLLIVVVAVVAHAVWGMAQNLAPDRTRATIAFLAAIAAVFWQTSMAQILIIVAGGLLGRWFCKVKVSHSPLVHISIGKRAAVISLGLFFVLLAAFPLLRHIFHLPWLVVFDSFFRTGALVYGGGHVVLPLLQTEVVPPGWVTPEQFLAGYGAAQAVPGPLFTFAAFWGHSLMAGPVH